MSITVYPFKKGLNSTKQLREGGCKVRYATSKPKQGVAIAWGNREPPPWADRMTWINRPASIPTVADKLKWAEFCQAEGVGLEYTTDMEVAIAWAGEDKSIVMCRTILNGSRGKGIVVARGVDEVVKARLYSKYFRKQREYRVIFSFLGDIVYWASKRRPTDAEMAPDDKLIRTTAQGYVYQVDKEPLPDAVVEAVQAAAISLSIEGLHLLAYDVAYNVREDTAAVIEANSAWGLNDISTPPCIQAMKRLGEEL